MDARWGALRLLVTAWLGLLVAWMPAPGHAADYDMAPAPGWVVAVTPGVPGAGQLDRSRNGVAYLLSDTQVLAGDGDRPRTRYRRLVSTALNASGVSEVANIEIPFDPSYQRLTLHSVRVVRNGRVISKLETARVSVIQRETELEARIYDGTKTASIFLDDVRAGDTVDYAYSTTGSNPVFKGAEFGTFALQYSVPVARIHTRLLLPRGRHVEFAARNTALKPAITEHDGVRERVWDVRDTPALTVESGAPDWYAPYAEVSWSEYPDWASVAAWATPLYRVPDTLGPALQVEVERIAKAESTPTGRMLAALRLVQGEVRYLGVEIGQNSHEPNPPALVFDRRFGDCKDKTLLTLTLLDRLGVEAHAALVNTSLRRGVAELSPRPTAFDHVLVQARIDGKTWWIDPTRYTQQADAAHIHQPDYGLALVVAPGSRQLVPMASAGAPHGSRSLRVSLDAEKGFDKPVRFTVQTVATGASAESQRSSLSSTNLEDVQKNYLNFYAGSYPHIRVAEPLKVDDDERGNRITTTESYLIDEAASPSSDGKSRVVGIHAPDIAQLLRDPAVTVRKAPLELVHPVDVSQHTEVLLPEDWPIKDVSTTIDDPAFRFEQTVKLEGRRLIITDHYQSLVDEVAAADMGRFLANLARARDIVGYELSWTTPGESGASGPAGLDRMNWLVWLLTIGMFGLWTWLALAVYRYDPAPRAGGDAGPVGIAGWLVVLAIVFLLHPFVFGAQLFQLADVVSIDTWSALTTYGSSSYHALWAPLLMFELAANSMQLVFSVLLLVLLFKCRSSFPRLAIGLMVAGVLMQVGDLALSSQLPTIEFEPGDLTTLVRTIIGVAIWSTYLMSSKRVKATFVKRWRQPVPPPLPLRAGQSGAAGPMLPAVVAEPD